MTSKLTGDWNQALKKMDGLNEAILKNLKTATLQSAIQTKDTLRKHIEDQDLPWPDHKKRYANWKKRKKKSLLKWVLTGYSLESMTYKLLEDGLSAFVGMLRTGKRKDGKPPTLIGSVMEYGSVARGIKARPLFRPTWKEMKPKIQDRYKRALAAALKG